MSAEIVAFALQDRYYKSVPDRMFAIADAFNEEYHELADAGCPVIQIEEPQIHLIAVRKIQDKVINPQLMVEVFNRTVKGLRAKTEVWAHSCWGNPSQQRMFAQVQSYKPALETYNTVDADVITFESSSSGGIDLEAIGKTITEKKIAIGVIDHHMLQVESPDEVAEKIRAALKFIPPERLVISTDCGMGREGMSRRHAFYKIVSLVLGTNIVRKELGFPLAECLAGRRALFAGGADEIKAGRRGFVSIQETCFAREDTMAATLDESTTFYSIAQAVLRRGRSVIVADHTRCRRLESVRARLQQDHDRADRCVLEGLCRSRFHAAGAVLVELVSRRNARRGLHHSGLVHALLRGRRGDRDAVHFRRLLERQ